jgi:serine/threonine protein phosphatase PrpC
MSHTLRYAARTDRGLLRANNQDSVFAGNRLLVVADGMGGHVAGDTASRLAVAAFAPLDQYEPHGRDLLTPLEHATEDGNEAIAGMVTEDPQLDGMGTTVTALMFDGPRLGIAHVGDSRAYLWRGGVLSQITHDDTFVQSLIDEGRITEAEAAQHPQRSLLLRALNGGSDVEPTLVMREARVGDRYLICSDGLSGVISAEAIADTLASYETAEAADRLIELALRGGGPDNVTVIVADVVDVGQTTPLEDEPGTPMDADATGPLSDLRFTKRMPRVALPREPDVATLAAERAAAEAAHRSFTEPITSPNRLGGDRFDDDHDLDGLDDDDLDLDDDDLDDLDDDDHDADRRGVARSRAVRGPSRTRRWMRRVGLAVAIAALLVVGGVLGVNWVGTQYYVGDNNGSVCRRPRKVPAGARRRGASRCTPRTSCPRPVTRSSPGSRPATCRTPARSCSAWTARSCRCARPSPRPRCPAPVPRRRAAGRRSPTRRCPVPAGAPPPAPPPPGPPPPSPASRSPRPPRPRPAPGSRRPR